MNRLPRSCWPCLIAFLAAPAWAQDNPPFYVGASLGVTQVSNVYRDASGANADRVLSSGVMAGLDKRMGRQRLSADASIQDNRYDKNSGLNNLSYTLRSGLDWQTVADLSGALSASRNRSLADFNIGGGIAPIRKSNIERNDEFGLTVRKGLVERYSAEAGWTHRSRDFSAIEYERFVYRQDTASLGLYLKPGASLRLGIAARRTDGVYPSYTIFRSGFRDGARRIDYLRNDYDLTATWNTGGASQLDTRVSRSRGRNSPADVLNDFSGTTGAVGWNWQPTAKIGLRVQVSRDTGVESGIRSGDVSRVYNSYRLTGSYYPTGKLTLQASLGENRSRRSINEALLGGSFDTDQSRSLTARWAYSRGISLSCQISRSSRDSSVLEYSYNSTTYGCTGQALLY